jgi:hypothetical protein
MFEEISNGYLIIDFEDSSAIEVGWVFLCQVFKQYGFYLMIAFIAVANCLVFYWFVKKYANLKYYWLSLFIYLFNPYLFLVESSAMRQTLALLIFLISIPFIINRNLFKFTVLICLASLFHTSAIVLLPIYLIASPSKITKKTVSAFLIVFLFTFFFGNFIFTSIYPFIDQYLNRYTVHTEVIQGGEFDSGFGFLLIIFFFCSFLYYSIGEIGYSAVLFKLAIFFYVLYPFSIYIQIFGRIQMYFEPMLIIATPLLIQKINNPLYKKVFILLILFFYLYSFIVFFNSPLWSSFYVYNTIFNY